MTKVYEVVLNDSEEPLFVATMADVKVAIKGGMKEML